jgi:hypothetical protein
MCTLKYNFQKKYAVRPLYMVLVCAVYDTCACPPTSNRKLLHAALAWGRKQLGTHLVNPLALGSSFVRSLARIPSEHEVRMVCCACIETYDAIAERHILLDNQYMHTHACTASINTRHYQMCMFDRILTRTRLSKYFCVPQNKTKQFERCISWPWTETLRTLLTTQINLLLMLTNWLMNRNLIFIHTMPHCRWYICQCHKCSKSESIMWMLTMWHCDSDHYQLFVSDNVMFVSSTLLGNWWTSRSVWVGLHVSITGSTFIRNLSTKVFLFIFSFFFFFFFFPRAFLRFQRIA